MKKILLLGGSEQQVIAIETAKKMGYYTILCDYYSVNPGMYVADEFFCVSTTDRDSILKIAESKSIDGIVAYSSDPAAPTAAFISEKMHLPGIPFEVAEKFCNKYLFRQFLRKNGFNVPQNVKLSVQSTISDIKDLTFPLLIKPSDSSGSKGITVIKEHSEFEAAKDSAAGITRNGILIAEEFIERDHPDVIEAEIFVVNGEIRVWGLMNTIRDKYTNPLLPAAYSYPLNISSDRIDLVKTEVSKLVQLSGVRYGAFNIEMIIDKYDHLYFLDAGPRNGGNKLPEFIGNIMGKNLIEATINAVMGNYDKLYDLYLDGISNGYWGMMVLHSAKSGIFDSIIYDEIASKYLYRESFFKMPGEKIESFNISRDAIGLAFFKFENKEIRDEIINDFSGKHIRIKLR